MREPKAFSEPPQDAKDASEELLRIATVCDNADLPRAAHRLRILAAWIGREPVLAHPVVSPRTET